MNHEEASDAAAKAVEAICGKKFWFILITADFNNDQVFQQSNIKDQISQDIIRSLIESKRFKSNAMWPDDSITSDYHDTEQEAEAVCWPR